MFQYLLPPSGIPTGVPSANQTLSPFKELACTDLVILCRYAWFESRFYTFVDVLGEFSLKKMLLSHRAPAVISQWLGDLGATSGAIDSPSGYTRSLGIDHASSI